MKKYIILCCLVFVLSGCKRISSECKNVWGRFVEWIIDPKRMEEKYGKPRTTFYTCPYWPNQEPRMPIIKPIEMSKRNNSEWTLHAIALTKATGTSCGDYQPVDYMYGDSERLCFHCPESTCFVNAKNIYYPERWIYVNIHDWILYEFNDKTTFEKNVGYDMIDKMISPDEYYKSFCVNENALPWIPDSVKNV